MWTTYAELLPVAAFRAVQSGRCSAILPEGSLAKQLDVGLGEVGSSCLRLIRAANETKAKTMAPELDSEIPPDCDCLTLDRTVTA